MCKPIMSLIREAAHRHDPWQVFTDFVAMSAISISNAVDLRQRELREADYLHLASRYDRHELALFPRMLAELVNALESDMADVLGGVFTDMNFGSRCAGQFFTPDSVARMMAAMNVGHNTRSLIEQRGFIRGSEPAVGAGAMVIALCRELRAQGINYQQHLHVIATDVDLRAVHMAYIQLSLLHVPAVIVHGNTLTLEEWSRWHTPAHILGAWDLRISAERGAHASLPVSEAPPLSDCDPSEADDDGPMPMAQLSLF